MTKISNLYGLTNYVTANSSGNVVIAAPTSGTALYVTGSAQVTGQLTLGSTITNGTYTYTLPSATGTLALASSLGSYVPYTGATQAVNLGAYDLTVNGIKVGKGGGAVYDNTVLGDSALTSNTSGSSNTAIGYSSLSANTIAGGNTAVGTYALSSNISGGTNTAIGYSAGSSITTGSNNVIIGGYAGTSSMSGNVILSDGGGNIRFQYDGTNTLLGQTGNLLVGVSLNAGYKLDVNGTARISGALSGTSATFSGSVTSSDALISTDGTNTIRLQKAYFGGIDAIYQTGTNAFGIYLGGGTYTAAKLYITNGGNVGIGTTSPTNGKLEVQQTATTAGLWVQTGGTTSSYTIADFRTGTNLSALQILGNGVSSFSGNVGINTTSPNRLFEVASGGDTGYIRVTGNRGNADGVHVGNIEFYNSNTSRLVGEVRGITGTGGTQSNSGQLAFYTNDVGTYTERMRITSGGNVGIGTTSPYNPGGSAQTSLEMSGTSYSTIYLSANSATVRGQIGADNINGWVEVGARTSHPLLLITNNTERMRITSGGRLLVGTTTENTSVSNLQVKADAGAQAISIIGRASDGIGQLMFMNAANSSIQNIIESTSSSFNFYTGSSERMRITSGGNVLIGTTSDNGAKLRVSGLNQSSNFVTDFGNASIPFGSYGTFYTVSNYQNALYMVTLQYNGYSNYTAYAIIAQNDSALVIMNQVNNNAQIQVSGLNIQGKNDSGVTVSMVYKIIKIG